ncbi:Coiled-coil domain-containing protein 42A [Intoshia linei]|uniref:Coiled-coil domain-containing protein 42A n=1 Tax=Intoshia linei TaxID=1819745 RepID=A0A177B3S1_9BILA|nr:Coiled-coil domain-containing protein 42A [Intoshia linei]
MSFNIEEYFKLIFEEKLLLNVPYKGDDQLTAATRLSDKKREIAEVEQALLAQKEEFQMKMEGLQHRKNEFHRKELKLKNSLLRFDKFLRENEMKKNRALAKITEEEKLKKEKDVEIEVLNEKIDFLKLDMEKYKKLCEKYGKYKLYLESIIEYNDDFNEVREILARHETLKINQNDLIDMEMENQNMLQDKKLMLLKYIESMSNESLNLNNQLMYLQNKYDKAFGNSCKWEQNWLHIKSSMSYKDLEISRIKMAVHNLYQLISKHQNIKKKNIDNMDTSFQLTKIKIFIQDLSDIISKIHKVSSASTDRD